MKKLLGRILVIIGCLNICAITFWLCFGSLHSWFYVGGTLKLANNICNIDNGQTAYSRDALLRYYDGNFYGTTIDDLYERFPDFQFRRTYQGFYAVVLGEGGERLFVFFDHKLKVYDYVLSTDGFPSREKVMTLIQRVPQYDMYEYFYENDIPFVSLDTGSLWLVVYYPNGIELFTFSGNDPEIYHEQDPTPAYSIGPYSEVFASCDCENIKFALFDRYSQAPVILEIDRRNEELPDSRQSRLCNFIVACGAGFATCAALALLCFTSLSLASKDLSTDKSSGYAKHHMRKWSLIYSIGLLVFIAAYCISLTMGYPAIMIISFTYLLAALLLELLLRKIRLWKQ